MTPLIFLLIVISTAAALTVGAFIHLLRSHVPNRALGLSGAFFAGALMGFMTAILLGVIAASLAGVDGTLGPVSAVLFLGFVLALCGVGGALAVMAMSRILHWKPAPRA